MPPSRFGLLSRVRDFMMRLFGSSPFGDGGQSADPFARVRAPKGRSPGDRSSAVALMEPREQREGANAVGMRSRR